MSDVDQVNVGPLDNDTLLAMEAVITDAKGPVPVLDVTEVQQFLAANLGFAESLPVCWGGNCTEQKLFGKLDTFSNGEEGLELLQVRRWE
ncbi:MAG TPA: hypothetical protein VK395_18135 [Gemmataceae bacterium]|nr:hypothetical protein [Gemmataceae bacterium]